jgi:FHA domain
VSSTHHSARYAPGTGVGVAGERIWLVVAGVPGDDLSLTCLETVHDGADAEDVLEVLLGAGLRTARDFAICEILEEGTCRILVRGSAQADVGVGGQIEAVSGRGVFADREIADVDWVVIRLGGESTEPIVPLSMGLVPTALIRLELESARRAPAVPDATPSGRPVPGDAGVQLVTTDAVSVITVPDSSDVQEIAALASTDEAELMEYDRHVAPPGPGGQEPGHPGTLAPHRDDVREPVHDPVEQGDDPEPSGRVRQPDEEVAAEVNTGKQGTNLVVSGADGNRYDSRDGTNPPTAEFIDAVPDFLAPGAGVSSVRPPRLPEVSELAAVAVPPPVREEPVTASVPQPIVPPSSVADEAGGRTVSRAAILRDQGGSVGQIVFAARCTQGHLSPAFAAACRVCGGAIPPQEPVEIPRPALGRLVVSTGDTVLLDRDVVLGREPHVPAGHVGGMPHLLRLRDPRQEISSQHAVVSLDYWHVTLTDVGSTNGTEIVTADGHRQRLVPNTPVVLEPGTTLVLAEVMDILFEATP